MSKPQLLRIHSNSMPGSNLAPVKFIDPAFVISGAPKEMGRFDYVDPTKQFTVGVWECSAYEELVEGWPCDEFTLVIQGGITITDSEERAEHFGPGQAFLIQRGFKCRFKLTETTRKYYVLFENKLAA